MQKDSFLPRAGGYRRPPLVVNELFNVSVAAVLIILALPLILLVMLVLLVCEGRPIFYRGERLGRNKSKFKMYKFRTLIRDAEDRLKGQLLGGSTDLITTTGKFLRDTRLDELPQLWNVLKRDMDLVGPRPVRPLVYREMCQAIPGYDKRFEVRPGLIGFAQLFTPHSSPKTIRSIIDNRLLHKQESPIWNTKALVLTAWFMLRAISIRGWRLISERWFRQTLLKQYREKRRYERIPARKARVYLATPTANRHEHYLGQVIDINMEAFLLRSDEDISSWLPADLKLQITTVKIGRRDQKTKTAKCTGVLHRTQPNADGTWDHVIMYEPASPLNDYLIHQYFLHESVG